MALNKVMLIGHLGADPEVRRLNSGDPVVNIRVATSENWRDKTTGERKEKTEWHSVVIFNEGAAKFAEQYLKKGAKVYVEGQLATRKWEDQQGQTRYATEIVLQKYRGELQSLDRAPSNRAPGAESADDYGSTRTRDSQGGGAGNNSGQTHGRHELDDEIPF